MRPGFTIIAARRAMAATVIFALPLAALPGAALAAIANDHPDQATIIEALPFATVQDTSGATGAAEDPDCGDSGHTVWFTYTADAVLDVYANTFGSDFDTTLSVYVDDGNSLTQLACNDDFESLQSQVFWTVEPGTTYLVMAGSFNQGEGGNLAFQMDVGIAPPPPPPPDPFEMSLTVEGGQVGQDGHVTLYGVATCEEPYVGAWFFAEVRQNVGRRGIVIGGASADIDCSPEGTPWTATTDYEVGRFSGGPAEVHGSLAVFDGYQFIFFDAEIRLGHAR
jgi:hypothetical protein